MINILQLQSLIIQLLMFLMQNFLHMFCTFFAHFLLLMFLAQANLITKTDFDTNLNRKITANKTKNLLVENEFEKPL